MPGDVSRTDATNAARPPGSRSSAWSSSALNSRQCEGSTLSMRKRQSTAGHAFYNSEACQSPGADIGGLVQASEAGDKAARNELFAMLYRELHRLAQHHLARSGGPLTLSATTLLHEAYLDISRREHLAFPERNSFMAYASRAMRGLVIDYCRSKGAQKRGGDLTFLSLDDVAPPRRGHRHLRAAGSRPTGARSPRSPARAAGRPEVLLRLHVRRAGRHARRVGAHRAARLGKGAAAPAPGHRRSRVTPSPTPSAYTPDGYE